ncbi:hypothetical protein CAOG_02897 [Capsaspora owczarzaki ATCC 30864]|uniref:hypothetical protein n=1 Tax=Capsaspora owczarzaki (strain ATCC 30864) TaxID=595528 RepID=UPI0001FE2A07|nr:hypothetical protein CAOG_02897 [Capsaspora owczarzaki ATCC 30864]|eukprot:XP_004363736.1 hypothetical protein CAOG_02897 [Capsaspora owczarzaki ATCC 30864]
MVQFVRPAQIEQATLHAKLVAGDELHSFSFASISSFRARTFSSSGQQQVLLPVAPPSAPPQLGSGPRYNVALDTSSSSDSTAPSVAVNTSRSSGTSIPSFEMFASTFSEREQQSLMGASSPFVLGRSSRAGSRPSSRPASFSLVETGGASTADGAAQVRQLHRVSSALLNSPLAGVSNTGSSGAGASATSLPAITHSQGGKVIIMMDSQTVIVMANDRACKLFGYGRRQFIGQPLVSMLASTESARFNKLVAKAESHRLDIISSGKVLDAVDAQGKVFPVSLWMKRVEATGQKARFVAVLEPVERITATAVLDYRGRFISADQQFLSIFGSPLEELAAMHADSLIPQLAFPLPSMLPPDVIFPLGSPSAHSLSGSQVGLSSRSSSVSTIPILSAASSHTQLNEVHLTPPRHSRLQEGSALLAQDDAIESASVPLTPLTPLPAATADPLSTTASNSPAPSSPAPLKTKFDAMEDLSSISPVSSPKPKGGLLRGSKSASQPSLMAVHAQASAEALLKSTQAAATPPAADSAASSGASSTASLPPTGAAAAGSDRQATTAAPRQVSRQSSSSQLSRRLHQEPSASNDSEATSTSLSSSVESNSGVTPAMRKYLESRASMESLDIPASFVKSVEFSSSGSSGMPESSFTSAALTHLLAEGATTKGPDGKPSDTTSDATSGARTTGALQQQPQQPTLRKMMKHSPGASSGEKLLHSSAPTLPTPVPEVHLPDLPPTLDYEARTFHSAELGKRQHIAAYTRDGTVFPLMATIGLDPGAFQLQDALLDDPSGVGPTGTLTASSLQKMWEPHPFFTLTVNVFTNLSGMVCFDAFGTIQSCNHMFVRLMFGYSRAELVGKPLSVLMPDLVYSLTPLNDLSGRSQTAPTPSSAAQHAAGPDSDDSHSASSQTSSIRRSGRGPSQSARTSEIDMESILVSTTMTPGRRFGARPTSQLTDELDMAPSDILDDSDDGSAVAHPLTLPEGTFRVTASHKDGQSMPLLMQIKRVILDDDSTLYCSWIMNELPWVAASSSAFAGAHTGASDAAPSEMLQRAASSTLLRPDSPALSGRPAPTEAMLLHSASASDLIRSIAAAAATVRTPPNGSGSSSLSASLSSLPTTATAAASSVAPTWRSLGPSQFGSLASVSSGSGGASMSASNSSLQSQHPSPASSSRIIYGGSVNNLETVGAYQQVGVTKLVQVCVSTTGTHLWWPDAPLGILERHSVVGEGVRFSRALCDRQC